MRVFFVFILAMLSCLAQAAGPTKVATIDRVLWPDIIDNQLAFDQASAAEIRMFVRVMNQTSFVTKGDIVHFTGIENSNPDEVLSWLQRTRTTLLTNYRHACHNCVSDWQGLVRDSDKPLAERYQAWGSASEKFYQRYLYEQVRLAALFPRITSEIDTFSHQEINGSELADGEFLLTYDDGPSPSRGAPLVAALNQQQIHAFFFLIGQELEKVKPAVNTYRGQCLGSHGYVHKSHQRLSSWAQSLAKTRQLLRAYQPGPYWFRPPYGQRNPEILNDLAAHRERVMLWNIDSQDWNHKLTNKQVQDRVMTLMLLWRHGVILYHEIHPRALDNLPALNRFVMQSGSHWLDCRHL